MCEVRAHPVRKRRPAVVGIGGDGWLHEVKFDGFRVHIRKLVDALELYSRSSGRFGQRLPLLVDVVRELPARPAIIDGEIVASDARGVPDAWRLLAAHLNRSIKALVFLHCANCFREICGTQQLRETR
jgi:ATP-dependent DNA ligase